MNTIILIVVLLLKKANDADYSALTQEIDRNLKNPKIQAGRVRITNYKNIYSKCHTNIW